MSPEARRRRRVRTPVLAVTAIAWVALSAAPAFPSGAAHDAAGPALAHHSHLAESPAPDASAGSLPTFLAGWPLMLMLMLTAMMAPLLIPALRHVYARSLPRRRRRAVTLLIAAYAATWAAGGLVLEAATMSAVARRPGVAVAAGVLTAVLWQLSPLKQRCLNRRHAHPPIAAFGRAADVGVLRFGGVHALWCLGSCWALMLLPLLAGGGHLAVMAAVTLWIWAEAFATPTAPGWRLRLPVDAARILAATARPRPSILSGQ
jgi:predicted metal-binding membrane protein